MIWPAIGFTRELKDVKSNASKSIKSETPQARRPTNSNLISESADEIRAVLGLFDERQSGLIKKIERHDFGFYQIEIEDPARECVQLRASTTRQQSRVQARWLAYEKLCR
jgi:hypothetical protein